MRRERIRIEGGKPCRYGNTRQRKTTTARRRTDAIEVHAKYRTVITKRTETLLQKGTNTSMNHESEQTCEFAVPRDFPICWQVAVYDRAAENRFPLKRKWFRFNYSRATKNEIEEVLRICDRSASQQITNAPPLKVGEVRISHMIGGSSYTSTKITNYRHLFDHIPNEKNLLTEEEAQFGCIHINLPSDFYFEDENEKRLTLIEVLDEEASFGAKTPEGTFSFVYDHPESIYRFGPASPERDQLWKSSDSELVAQIISVFTQLKQSRWIHSECAVYPASESETYSILPTHEDCRAIIIPFRKLYSKNPMDDLFNRSCNIHSRHCPKHHPYYSWIESYKREFNDQLNRPIGHPLPTCILPARRYIDAFAYGANELHVTSKKDEPAQDLEELLNSHPKDMVVLGFHIILNRLLNTISMVVPLINQNTNYWIREHGFESSSKMTGSALFESQ